MFLINHLDTRVLLLDGVLLLEGGPGVASVGEGRVVSDGSNLAVALDKLHRETLGRVPANVAVHEPGARVISLPSHDEVSRGGKHSGIATGRVASVEGDGAGVGSGALCEDEEVVAVEMNGVGDGEGGLDDKVDPLVGLVELDDGVVVLPGGVAVDDGLKGRVGPVDEHGGAVEVPLEEAGGVLADGGALELIPVGAVDSLGDVGGDVVRLVVAGVGVGVGAGGGGGDGAGVGDDTLDVVCAVVVGAGGLGNGADPEVVGDVGLVGSDDDVVALAHADVEDGGVVGGDGNQVGSDDLHGVVVNHELPVGVDGGVDQSQTVRGAGGPGDVVAVAGLSGGVVVAVDVGTVNETVVKGWRAGGLGSGVELVDGLVIPVVEEHHAEVLVVVGSGGAVDDDAAKDTLPRLKGEVGVVPGRTILQSSPGVGDGVIGGRGALSDGADAVVLVGVVLANAVEVNAGTVVGSRQRVGDVNDDGITPVGEDGRARNGAVDGHGGAGDSIGSDGDVGQLKVVLASDTGVGRLGPVVGVDGVVAPLASCASSVAAAGSARKELGLGAIGEGAEAGQGRGHGARKGTGHEDRLEHDDVVIVCAKRRLKERLYDTSWKDWRGSEGEKDESEWKRSQYCAG